MRSFIRLLIFCVLLLAGVSELHASIPKTRVWNFFPLAAESRPEVALQVPELRLDNPALYGESASGATLWTKFDPEGLASAEAEAFMKKNHPYLFAALKFVHGLTGAIVDPFGLQSTAPTRLPKWDDFNPARAIVNEDLSPNWEGMGRLTTGAALAKFGGGAGEAETPSVTRSSVSEGTGAADTTVGKASGSPTPLQPAVEADTSTTYHRLGDSPETVAKIKESGELWGAAPRNSFSSDIPKVKTYSGPLPEGAGGIELEITVPPNENGVPGKPTWSGDRPGVVTEDGFAKVKAEVTKDTVTPTEESAKKPEKQPADK